MGWWVGGLVGWLVAWWVNGWMGGLIGWWVGSYCCITRMVGWLAGLPSQCWDGWCSTGGMANRLFKKGKRRRREGKGKKEKEKRREREEREGEEN